MTPSDHSFDLPFYLTGERAEGFHRELQRFRKEKPVNLFQNIDDASLIQGDVADFFDFYSAERGEAKRVRGIALSNSCDISLENRRHLPPTVVFAPTIALTKYREALTASGVGRADIDAKFRDIRLQRVSDIFFIPSIGEMEEQIALLSQASNVSIKHFFSKSPVVRSRLSMIGLYLLLLKISFHFCRMHEDIERKIT